MAAIFADDIFKCIFLNENVYISIETSLKFVPRVPINNIPALVRIMAWHRLGDEQLSEPMMDSLLTHISVPRPQWVNVRDVTYFGQHHTVSSFIKILSAGFKAPLVLDELNKIYWEAYCNLWQNASGYLTQS